MNEVTCTFKLRTIEEFKEKFGDCKSIANDVATNNESIFIGSASSYNLTYCSSQYIIQIMQTLANDEKIIGNKKGNILIGSYLFGEQKEEMVLATPIFKGNSSMFIFFNAKEVLLKDFDAYPSSELVHVISLGKNTYSPKTYLKSMWLTYEFGSIVVS